MEDKKLDVWERQDFPPWSVRILILWMLGFLILSTAIFTVGGMLGAHINISFKLDLSMKEFMSIVSIPSEMLYVGIVSIFVLFQLKRASFSLSDVWGESKIGLKHICIALLLGVLFMSFWILVSRLITGYFAPPPAFPKWMDWRFMLCAQLLVNAFMAGIFEEIFYRGILYRVLRKSIFREGAVGLSALIFTIYHVEYLLNSILNLIFVFFFGVIAAVLFERTQSLSTNICFHLSTNATASIIPYLIYLSFP